MNTNVKKFNELFNFIQESIKELADIYYEDYLKDTKVELIYVEKTPLTRTMLRRLISIAKGDLLPDSFFIGNSTAYRMVSTMSKDQQEMAMHKKIKVVSQDGSHWEKKFEDLTPRQMNMVYDQRSKEFRSEQGQKEWIKNNPPSIRISNGKGRLKEDVKHSVINPPKEMTKSQLINKLKAKGINAKDLAYLANSNLLMEAIKISIKEEVKI